MIIIRVPARAARPALPAMGAPARAARAAGWEAGGEWFSTREAAEAALPRLEAEERAREAARPKPPPDRSSWTGGRWGLPEED